MNNGNFVYFAAFDFYLIETKKKEINGLKVNELTPEILGLKYFANQFLLNFKVQGLTQDLEL